VSLTSHLRDPRSPVRAWFGSRLGATSDVVRAANEQLRGPGHERDGRVVSLSRLGREPSIPRIGDAALVGHGVDWLLRLSLADEPPPERSASALGAGRIVAVSRDPGALVVFEQVVERCIALAPARGLSGAAWLDLCRCCLVLAWMERAYRAPFGTETIVDRVDGNGDLAGWSERLVTRLDLEDLDALGRAALEDHADLRDGRVLVPNPTFALSAALGGADADLIAGATLLDFKTTATTRVVTGQDVWQVVGYALADTDDVFGLTHAGVSALRWRTRVIWPLDVLLGHLAGEALTLHRARGEFADVVRRAPVE
jgi:hypothetical protein